LETEMEYKRSLSIVVPVYNSEESLPALQARLAQALPEISDLYELILVNDGSRDRSWDIICQLAEQYPWVHGIQLMRNFGQHNALLCGIRAAKYDFIVTMDDDLQNPPEEIVKLVDRLDEGFDMVYGKPQKEQHGLWRDLASQVTKIALQGAMGAETARNVSAFRGFRSQVREAFANYQGPFPSIDVLLTWGTTRFSAIEVRHNPRQFGVSNYNFRKLVIHTLNMMTGFSVIPLQVASLVGFLFTLFGGLVLLYVIGRYLIQGGVVPGFAFLASIIAIFSGAQLFALGIMGEYLARMHFRLMERPSYIVRSDTMSARD
jgi:glycosyltransferase involved in cell wall biosynthesis